MSQSSLKVIVKDPFEMPAVDDTTVLTLRECADLVPHCWIWNESVGYLEVVTYSGYDIYVTVKNVGMKENATSETIFPSCMEFLITAPNATPIIDNTVTCLRADFKCPTVGQEALMSVDSTSAIRVGDIIIVDTRYQYLVTEIINEHTMKVLNEEKGKEGGVIDVKCNECVPVKILESTHCCEALQDQVDDIYNRIDTKKSVVSNNVLLSVDHGLDAISDVSYDIELDIDTDLSKYDNTVSKFSSFIYFTEEYNSGLSYARFIPDTNSGASKFTLGSSPKYYSDAYIWTFHGVGSNEQIIFVSGGTTKFEINTTAIKAYSDVLPNSSSSFTLGNASKTWSNVYTDSITLNGTTYTSIPTVNDATLDIQKNGTSVGTFTANASSNSTINITVPTDTTDLTNGAGYITSASLPTVNDAKLTIYESDGVTPFVEFTANASSAVTATLPAMATVNDAKLTIYESDGITPFVEFTANASSAVTATLPSSGTNLIYFEESYDSGTDTATFRPKNSTATNFNIGRFYNVFAQRYSYSDTTHSYIAFPGADGGSIIINNGTSGTYGTDYNNIIFELGNTTKVTIDDTQITPSVDVTPYTNNTYSLGNINRIWKDAYINNLYADNLEFNTTYADFDFSTITGNIDISGGKTIKTSDITISNPYTHGDVILFIVVNCNICRVRSVANSGTTNHAGPRFQGYLNRTTDSSQWNLLDHYSEYQLTTNYEDRSYSLTYTFTTTVPPSTTYTYNASIVITAVGFGSGTLKLPGGINQKGRMDVLYGHIN